MSRRGRPRKKGPRERNGRSSRTLLDGGTEQAQRRRAWLAQGGNETMTTDPLGILRVNNAITENQHRAGCHYALLFQLKFGRTSVAAANYDGFGWRRLAKSASPLDEDWLAARERELERSQQAVARLSIEAKAILDAVVVFGRVPRWMAPLPPQSNDVREARLLVMALDVIAEVFGHQRARVA